MADRGHETENTAGGVQGNPTGNVITRDTARVVAQPAARDSLAVPTRTEIPLKIPTFRCISSLYPQGTEGNIILPSRPLLFHLPWLRVPDKYQFLLGFVKCLYFRRM